jgi:hypothetical protein
MTLFRTVLGVGDDAPVLDPFDIMLARHALERARAAYRKHLRTDLAPKRLNRKPPAPLPLP